MTSVGAPSAAQVLFRGELNRKITDPGRTGIPGSAAAMLRELAGVVSRTHTLDAYGDCAGCTDARTVDWPCEEIIALGRIYGVRWVRP